MTPMMFYYGSTVTFTLCSNITILTYDSNDVLLWQHGYIYIVLIEAMATFVGQLSVLCLIAIFGATTTAMVSYQQPYF
jgi:hypothetical protein